MTRNLGGKEGLVGSGTYAKAQSYEWVHSGIGSGSYD